MREIKFRAWDKDRKCFLPCIVGNTDINDDKWICPLTYCEVNGVYNWYHNDTCEIMQYTGLKDKNGKEIYEGDILKRTLLPTKRIVNYSTIKWIDFKACLSSVDLDGSSVTFISDYINNSYELEVIGNIWEDGDLLDSK